MTITIVLGVYSLLLSIVLISKHTKQKTFASLVQASLQELSSETSISEKAKAIASLSEELITKLYNAVKSNPTNAIKFMHQLFHNHNTIAQSVTQRLLAEPDSELRKGFL